MATFVFSESFDGCLIADNILENIFVVFMCIDGDCVEVLWEEEAGGSLLN